MHSTCLGTTTAYHKICLIERDGWMIGWLKRGEMPHHPDESRLTIASFVCIVLILVQKKGEDERVLFAGSCCRVRVQ